MSLITLVSIGLLIASLGIAMAIYFVLKRKPQTAFLDPEMLRHFSWDEFDVLIAESFRRDGFVVRDNPGSGIDHLLEKGDETFLVSTTNERRRWRPRRKPSSRRGWATWGC